jgi:hypothetical protein
VAPAGAPNAGNVLVADHDGARVQEFTADGDFVRLFGWDVDADDPSTGFEICTAASGHQCKYGASGTGLGQFSQMAQPRSLAADSSGAIYAVDGIAGVSSNRVQKFTPTGSGLTPSLFGTSEVQAVTG